MLHLDGDHSCENPPPTLPDFASAVLDLFAFICIGFDLCVACGPCIWVIKPVLNVFDTDLTNGSSTFHFISFSHEHVTIISTNNTFAELRLFGEKRSVAQKYSCARLNLSRKCNVYT